MRLHKVRVPSRGASNESVNMDVVLRCDQRRCTMSHDSRVFITAWPGYQETEVWCQECARLCRRSDNMTDMESLVAGLNQPVRSALAHLYDFAYLQNHPLASLPHGGRGLAIVALKGRTEERNLAAAEAKLACLRATKARFTTEVQELCSGYLQARKDKEEAEQQKGEACKRLDKHRAEVVWRRQTVINEILVGWARGSGSRKAVNPRGRPSSTAAILPS